MDRKIQILLPNPAPNGEPNPVWVVMWSGYAAKKDQTTARESESGQTIIATGNTVWTIRYLPGITPTMRVVDPADGLTYNIISVGETGRKEALTLICERYNQ